jgi:hypothetical protein
MRGTQMGLLAITALAVALFSLLHWLIIPRLRRNLRFPRPERPLRLVATLVLATLLRSASLIAAGTFGVIVVVLAGCAILGYGLPIETLAVLFRASSELRETVEALDKGWSALTIGVLCIALWISVRRDAARQLSQAVDASIAQMKADIAAGQLEELEPTPEMRQVTGRLVDMQKAIAAANAATPRNAVEADRLSHQSEAVKEELVRLDIMRRLDLGSQLTELTGPQRPQNRFAALMVSAGLLQPLSLASKAIGTVSLALLAPALITLAGDDLGQSIAQVNAQLHRLIVAQSREEAERDWLRSQPAPPQPREVSPSDQTMIRQLSYHYQAYVRLRASNEYDVPARAFHLASTDARREILANYAAGKPSSLEVHGGVASDRHEAGILNLAARADNDGPEAARFRNVLKTVARSTPQSEWEQFRHRAEAFLQTAAKPLTTQDIGQRLFAEVLNMGASISVTTGPDSSALRDVVSELSKPGDMAEKASELMDVDIIRFVTGIRDAGTPTAAKPDLPFGVRRYDDKSDKWAKDIRDNVSSLITRTEEDVRNSPPTLDQRLPSDADGKPALTAARALMRDAGSVNGAARASDVVASYRDVFPGVVGDEGTTPRATLLREFPHAAEAVGQGAAEAVHAFARARSYAALRGFSKIGGVLVGLLPEEGPDLAITGLDWNDTASGVTLSLQTAKGNKLSYGPFRAEIIRIALAYAADGRPITATMPITPIGRQVLLHPALVDTALGCEARLIDQFVDGATGGDRERSIAENRVYSDLALYEVAWSAQFRHLDHSDLRPTEALTYLREVAARLAKDDKIEAIAQTSLSNPQGWSNADLSPMLTRRNILIRRWSRKSGAASRVRDRWPSSKAASRSRIQASTTHDRLIGLCRHRLFGWKAACAKRRINSAMTWIF